MRSPAQRRQSVLFSIAAHGAALGVVLLVSRMRPPELAPKHLPGTVHGTEVMLSYQMLGAPPAAASARTSETAAGTSPPKPAKAPRQKASQLSESAPSTTGNASEGSLGDGDMTIALLRFHPHPEPDLSTLPPGTSGDIVLDAVIDAEGHVAHLSVARSLGVSVDRQVVATVQQWTFTPAMRSGTPVESEQEILIHYERPGTAS
ncbi:MAG TPA: TonB family protein [Acidobacteriaceae bacterium]